MANYRGGRINEEVRKEVSDIIRNNIKDPRLTAFVRKELGHRINLRYTPEVLFELDNSIDKGMHIDSLLQKIKEK